MELDIFQVTWKDRSRTVKIEFSFMRAQNVLSFYLNKHHGSDSELILDPKFKRIELGFAKMFCLKIAAERAWFEQN